MPAKMTGVGGQTQRRDDIGSVAFMLDW